MFRIMMKPQSKAAAPPPPPMSANSAPPEEAPSDPSTETPEPPPEADPSSDPSADPSGDPTDPSSASGGSVDPTIAGYMGPEMGPFQCDHCVHWMDGACEVVSGPIEAAGCCNLFVPAGADDAQQGMEGASLDSHGSQMSSGMPEADDVVPVQ